MTHNRNVSVGIMDRSPLKLLKPFNNFAIRFLSSPKTLGYAECFKLDKTLLLIYQSLHKMNKIPNICCSKLRLERSITRKRKKKLSAAVYFSFIGSSKIYVKTSFEYFYFQTNKKLVDRSLIFLLFFIFLTQNLSTVLQF